ncbi:MAG: protein UsfY [Mycobacterium sp.]
MPDKSYDPVDDARTNSHVTGEALKDARNTGGLVLSELAVVAFASSLYLFGIGKLVDGGLVGVLALLIGTLGVVWVLVEHHRFVQLEMRWEAERRPRERHQ